MQFAEVKVQQPPWGTSKLGITAFFLSACNRMGSDTQYYRKIKAVYGEFPLPRPSYGFILILDCDVTKNLLCRLIYITEKLLLAPIYGSKSYLISRSCVFSLVVQGFSLNTLIWTMKKKMHNFKTCSKAHWIYILGVVHCLQ